MRKLHGSRSNCGIGGGERNEVAPDSGCPSTHFRDMLPSAFPCRNDLYSLMPMLDSQKRMQPTWLMLCIAFVIHVALALPTTLSRRELHHDDAITLLAITGHQMEYYARIGAKAPPYGVWATAGDWQQFVQLEPSRPPELPRIAEDLAQADIHPPLYFWLFSGVAQRFGATIATGLGLNLVLDLFTILSVFLLGKKVFRDDRKALLGAWLWALSPGPLEAMFEMRQYALLALLTTMFGYFVARKLDTDTRSGFLDALATTILCALGMLTHYHFLLVVCAALALVTVEFGRKNIRSISIFALPTLLGTALGLLAHPYVLVILRRQGTQTVPFTWPEFAFRLGGVLVGMGRFLVWSIPMIVLWMIVLVVGIVFALRAPKGTLARVLGSVEGPVRRVLICLGLTFLMQVALFLAFRSPAGAMRAKYLVIDYPFVACGLAWFLTRPATPARIARIIPAVMLMSSLIATVTELVQAKKVADSIHVTNSARRMVLDTVARGSLPVALWNIRPDMPVFAANQDVVAAQADTFKRSLEPGTLLIVDAERGNAKMRAEFQHALAEHFQLREMHMGVFGNRIVYEIQGPRSAPSER